VYSLASNDLEYLLTYSWKHLSSLHARSSWLGKTFEFSCWWVLQCILTVISRTVSAGDCIGGVCKLINFLLAGQR
jgi:hypothetical protein